VILGWMCARGCGLQRRIAPELAVYVARCAVFPVQQISIRIEAVLDRLANILKQRLAAQQSPDSEHPSPDTLVAFVERGLRADQRERVLSHLGLCSVCRQTLALAALEPSEGRPSLSAVPSSTRVRFPAAMRWASAVAALAVAAGVGALFYEHQDKLAVATSTAIVKTQVAERPVSASNQAPQSAEASGTPAAAPKIATSASGPAVAQLNRAGHREHLENKKAKPAGVLGGLVASSRADSGPAPAYVADAVTGTHASAPPAQADRAFQTKPGLSNAASTVEVQSQLEVRPAPQAYAQSNGRPATVELRRTESLSKSAVISGTAPQSQPAVGATMKAVAAPAIGGSVKPHAAYAESLARWTISANGKLQRVSQNGDAATVQPAPGLTVRAVAAQGIEVWAAGSQPDLSATEWQQRPALFHSSDAGETWTKIDGPWQGAIQSLALLDLRSLTLVTSDGRWTTTDAGKSWARK